MSENTKINSLVERFGRYMGERPGRPKTSQEVSESFKKKLAHMDARSDDGRTAPSKSTARRHQPPRIANLKEEIPAKKQPQLKTQQNPDNKPLKPLPNLGKARKISMKHAKRLARFAPFIEKAAAKHNVPVELICGVILQESGGNHKAVSHCGARGLMQLMPATARRFGVKNSFDPAQNIDGGTKYLRWLLDRFDGDIKLAVAAYNAGEGNVEKYGNKIPPFKETQAYVPAVISWTKSMIEVFASRHVDVMPDYARKA